MRDLLGELWRGVTLRGDEVPITLTHHVVERWSERTGRDLGAEQNRVELSRMLGAL